MIKIKQKNYPELKIDTSEKDIVQIFMNTSNDPQVVQIERKNLITIIKILLKQEKNNNLK